MFWESKANKRCFNMLPAVLGLFIVLAYNLLYLTLNFLTFSSWYDFLKAERSDKMSSNMLNQLHVPERSRSCIGLSTPLSSRQSPTKLYRSLSFASPASNDISLDNINELSHQMTLLEDKISSIDMDRRYNNTRTEKAIIQNHCLNLEEKLLDTETRLAEEQRRYREMQKRMQREIELLTENKTVVLRSLEEENARLLEDIKNLRSMIERKDGKLEKAEAELREVRAEFMEEIQKSTKKLFESAQEQRKQKSLHELETRALNEENELLIEKIRQNGKVHKDHGLLEHLQSEIQDLRQTNRLLQDANEELQAGIYSSLGSDVSSSNGCSCKHCETGSCNLAAELEAFVSEQADRTMSDIQEENTRLKNYLESLLLKIIGHYPQMLEIKTA